MVQAVANLPQEVTCEDLGIRPFIDVVTRDGKKIGKVAKVGYVRFEYVRIGSSRRTTISLHTSAVLVGVVGVHKYITLKATAAEVGKNTMTLDVPLVHFDIRSIDDPNNESVLRDRKPRRWMDVYSSLDGYFLGSITQTTETQFQVVSEDQQTTRFFNLADGIVARSGKKYVFCLVSITEEDFFGADAESEKPVTEPVGGR